MEDGDKQDEIENPFQLPRTCPNAGKTVTEICRSMSRAIKRHRIGRDRQRYRDIIICMRQDWTSKVLCVLFCLKGDGVAKQ